MIGSSPRLNGSLALAVYNTLTPECLAQLTRLRDLEIILAYNLPPGRYSQFENQRLTEVVEALNTPLETLTFGINFRVGFSAVDGVTKCVALLQGTWKAIDGCLSELFVSGPPKVHIDFEGPSQTRRTRVCVSLCGLVNLDQSEQRWRWNEGMAKQIGSRMEEEVCRWLPLLQKEGILDVRASSTF